MDDLISRQAAIDALMNNEPSAWYNDDYERGEIARFHEDVTTIKNVPSVRRKRKPSAQPEPRWIPVESEPPKEKERYWVCTDTGYQCECRWTNNRFGMSELDDWGWSIFDIPQYTKVVAYMPLPGPYERSEDEQTK